MTENNNVVSISQKPDLANKEQTVRALVLIHGLLADGTFPGRMSEHLSKARAFVEMIHAQALKDLESDPEYQEKKKKEKETNEEKERSETTII